MSPPAAGSIQILGPLEVTGSAGPAPFSGLKAKAVLALLALNAERPVTTQALVQMLWRDAPPASAANAVQVYIAAVRKVLAHTQDIIVETLSGGYCLHAPPAALDRDRFMRAIDDAHTAMVQGDRNAAAEAYARALAESRGPALFGLYEFDELRVAGGMLDEIDLSVFAEHCANEIVLGRGAKMLPELEQRARKHPFREDLWYLLVLELYRVNRQTEALAALRSIRFTLADQLGVDPGRRLQELERRILQHDPALILILVEPGRTSTQSLAAHTDHHPKKRAHLVDAAGRKVLLVDHPLIVGRAGNCDVVLTHRQVSAEHARITLSESEVIITDLSSKNGTTVNDELVDSAQVNDGDRVAFGGVEFTFRSH